MKMLIKILTISLLLVILVTSGARAQIIFKGDFVKSYAADENPKKIKKQYFDCTIIFKNDSVGFIDKGMWHHLLYTVIKIENLPETKQYRWICEDRIYLLNTKESTVVVTYPSTKEINYYYGYFILDNEK